MAIADMAAQGSGSLIPLTDISRRQGISLNYLEQLFAKLRRAGLVDSYRGSSGGYVLAHSAKNLTLNKIIHAVDENIQAHGCSP